MAERISEAEQAVMEALWNEAPLTAQEVADRVSPDRDWSLNTVKTLLGRLLAKEAILHEEDGRRYLYRPKLHYDWHWDHNTGNGDMGNQGIHQMDIARWGIGKEAWPTRIQSSGGRFGLLRNGFRDKPAHPGEGDVPAEIGEFEVDLRQPFAFAGQLQGLLAGFDERVRIPGDEDPFQIAIMADDVGDRGRDNWPAAGQIFGRLRGRDEFGGIVDREWHQRDVPTAEVGG